MMRPEIRTEVGAGGVDAPRHVAIIMDGNGRWATARGLPRYEGHRRGIETLRRIVRHAGERGVEYLTLYSFSSENWSRPAREIRDLMNLLRRFVRTDLAEIRDNNVRIRVIGSREGLPADILDILDEAERETKNNDGMHLVVAFNYGGRDEIARAARALAEKVAAGDLGADEITPAVFEAALDTAGIPDPDVLIRTSGEKRTSNFLPWQLAYTEFVFVPTLWPDFSPEEFDAALEEFAGRERRYGAVGSAG